MERKPYKSRGGRIFSFTEAEYKEQLQKQGRNSFVPITDAEITSHKPVDGVRVYYPAWNKFLMYDGYGYIDYQYRTYGPQHGLHLDTESSDKHKFALVHHNPYKVTEIAKHWKKPIVAYTMWESDTFPDRHFDAIKDCYAIVVPSNFVKKTLKRQGYDKEIYVCNQGIDTNHYKYFDRPKPSREFKFLHNATGNPRKGWDLVVKAFQEEFKNDENVTLTMKGIIKQKNNPLFVPFMSIPNINWVDTNYTREETVKMYQEHHCMVFPTRGEGWGLVPHESVMTGLPTITTKGHGQDDYWAPGMIPVKATKVPAQYVQESPIKEFQDPKAETWKNTGKWYEADLEDLKKKMREVYNNWEEYKTQAEMGSVYLSRKFDHISMVKRLQEILTKIHDSII